MASIELKTTQCFIRLHRPRDPSTIGKNTDLDGTRAGRPKARPRALPDRARDLTFLLRAGASGCSHSRIAWSQRCTGGRQDRGPAKGPRPNEVPSFDVAPMVTNMLCAKAVAISAIRHAVRGRD